MKGSIGWFFHTLCLKGSSVGSRHLVFSFFCALALCLNGQMLESKPAAISYKQVYPKLQEIMHFHVSHKELSPELVKRGMNLLIENLDPNKTYFIESEIHAWIEPSNSILAQVIRDFKKGAFPEFENIFQKMDYAIKRRHLLESKLDKDLLPTGVCAKEFKSVQWCHNEEELYQRIQRIRALQIETALKLDPELKDLAVQRLNKRKTKQEEEITEQDKNTREQMIATYILKAMASALDTHTMYFTPNEANQFMINVQQRLFGIGAQLRDDLSGFTIVKIVEGGPAEKCKELRLKDRIIAVNGVPVVGMEINEAVDLIRGEEGSEVILTVVRDVQKAHGKEMETKQVKLHRGEVVIKEARVESSVESFGNGVIAYLRLHTFYEDSESSSAHDLASALQKIKDNYNPKAVVLDLRFNAGGMLAQAAFVAGLFITKGIIVSIKDENSHIQHLRDFDGKTIWDGPLAVLINRASASASEIVAQSLQDYGRALVIGDDKSFGKGTFQTFTLSNEKSAMLNPQGEYKVTRGRYYTVSGKSPQLIGVKPDIIVPSGLAELEIGEEFAKNPLATDSIKENFGDDLSDIPANQKERIRKLYHFSLQPKLTLYAPYMDQLKKNSQQRLAANKPYQAFIKQLKEEEISLDHEEIDIHPKDFQLVESYNVVKDLLYLMERSCKEESSQNKKLQAA